MSHRLLTFFCAILSASSLCASAAAEGPIAIGTRRELLVDNYLIDRTDGQAELRLHQPTRREIVLVFDQPWEGNASAFYNTVFFDGDRYRM